MFICLVWKSRFQVCLLYEYIFLWYYLAPYSSFFFLTEALHGFWPWTFHCLNLWATVPVCWEDTWGRSSFLNPPEPLSSVVFLSAISMVACFLWCPGSVPLPQFILDLFSPSSLLFLFSCSNSVLLPRASFQYKALSSKGQLQERLAVGCSQPLRLSEAVHCHTSAVQWANPSRLRLRLRPWPRSALQGLLAGYSGVLPFFCPQWLVLWASRGNLGHFVLV